MTVVDYSNLIGGSADWLLCVASLLSDGTNANSLAFEDVGFASSLGLPLNVEALSKETHLIGIEFTMPSRTCSKPFMPTLTLYTRYIKDMFGGVIQLGNASLLFEVPGYLRTVVVPKGVAYEGLVPFVLSYSFRLDSLDKPFLSQLASHLGLNYSIVSNGEDISRLAYMNPDLYDSSKVVNYF